jgi:hypothetical protein
MCQHGTPYRRLIGWQPQTSARNRLKPGLDVSKLVGLASVQCLLQLGLRVGEGVTLHELLELTRAALSTSGGAKCDFRSAIAHALMPLVQMGVYLTLLTSGVKPWMRTSSLSPEVIGPTPLGVPVRMMSPGSRVRFVEMKLTNW